MTSNGNVTLDKTGEKCTEEKAKASYVLDNNEKTKVEKKSIWSLITLEPMWIGIMISLSMSVIGLKNLFLQRACLVDLGYSEDMCFRSEGSVKAGIETESQTVVSSLSIASGFVGGIITSIILVFVGPWSDSSGRRKPLILLPLLGTIVTSIGLLTLQAFPKISTIWLLYIELIPMAIGGNYTLLIMAAFNYLGDICYKTGRCATTVMGSNTGAITACMVVGSTLGPVLYRTVGLVGLFSISLVLEVSSLIYVIWKVTDINIAEKVPTIFNINLPYQALKCVFKKREGNGRKMVLLMVLVPCFNSIPMVEIPITYMYLRKQFDWTEVEFGIFIAYRSIIQVIGAICIVKLLKHKFKLRDEVVGMLGAISQLSATVAFMVSFQPWMIFAFSTLGILKSGVMIAERPVLNRQIIASEQGKINCITAVLDKCLSFVIIPLVNYIYNVTLTSLPSCFMVVTAAASIFQLICYVLVEKKPTEDEGPEKKLTTYTNVLCIRENNQNNNNINSKDNCLTENNNETIQCTHL